MKHTPPNHRRPHVSTGVRIDNSLSMALHGKGRKRLLWELLLLAELGMLCLLFSFLSMFVIPCHFVFLTVVAALMVLFYGIHAAAPGTPHYSMMFMLFAHATYFYVRGKNVTAGLLYILNYIYQAIYMSDWTYFSIDPVFDPTISITETLVYAIFIISWLLGFAVVRYQNFFLVMLVTFPVIEVGFFFGIAPDHIPMAGLIAFWCGMGAVQLASGSGSHRRESRTGFLRRRNTFSPVPSMRFLLTEHAGLLTALLTLAICLGTEGALRYFHYERPDAVKELRTDFQYYAASIELSDLSTIFPFLKDNSAPNEPDTVVELGRNGSQEFQNTVVSSITMTQRPLGHIYLRFGTYDTYGHTRWKQEVQMDETLSGLFEAQDYYPPEFLYYTALSLGFEQAEMTLESADDTLSRCVPYGCAKDDALHFRGDLVTGTDTRHYTLFTGLEYETLLRDTISYEFPASAQLEQCREDSQALLGEYLAGRQETTVRIPQSASLGPVYYGGEEGLALRSEAAVMAACGYTDFAFENYTAVPESEKLTDVRNYFSDILEGFDARSATASETMLILERLRERLCANVEYTLSPGRTPPGEDYVYYFLMENHKGYCAHYASAGTLLARMAGIPARYCEGYLVEPTCLEEETDDDGTVIYTAQLLDSSAHGWTEVYIDGFGWIPFEFTYSYFTPPEFPEELTTEPPTDAPSEDPTEAPSEETVTETELVTVPVAPETETVEIPTGFVEPRSFLPLFIVLGIAAFIALFVTWLVLWRRSVLAKRELKLSDPIGDAAAAYAWSLILSLLARCGVNTQAGSIDALARDVCAKCSHLLDEESIRQILRTGTKLRYSPHALSDSERETLIAACRTLSERYYNTAKPLRRLWLKWFCHII